MSIIYFITTQDIDTFQKKLQETLFKAYAASGMSDA